MSWQRGREEILDMLERGVGAGGGRPRPGRRLISAARRHVKSAETLGDDDPELAYAAIYDASFYSEDI